MQEDFAQQLVLNRLEGLGQRQTVKQGIIDVIRGEYGKNPVETARLKKEYARVKDEENRGNKELNEALFFSDMTKGLTEKDREFILLRFRYGFDFYELGEHLGTSSVWAFYEEKRILKIIKKKHFKFLCR